MDDLEGRSLPRALKAGFPVADAALNHTVVSIRSRRIYESVLPRYLGRQDGKYHNVGAKTDLLQLAWELKLAHLLAEDCLP